MSILQLLFTGVTPELLRLLLKVRLDYQEEVLRNIQRNVTMGNTFASQFWKTATIDDITKQFALTSVLPPGYLSGEQEGVVI